MAWNNKGQVMGQTGLVFGAIAIVISVAIGAVVLQNLNSTQTAGSGAANVTRDGLQMTTQYASLLPTVGIVLVATLILGLVAGGLGAFGRR